MMRSVASAFARLAGAAIGLAAAFAVASFVRAPDGPAASAPRGSPWVVADDASRADGSRVDGSRADGAVLFSGGRGQDDLPVALTELLVPPGAKAPDGGAIFDRARKDKADREALVAEVVRLEAELKTTEDLLAAERSKTANLEQELVTARARIADLEAKVADLTAQSQQLSNQLGVTQAQLSQANGQLSQAQLDLQQGQQRELFLQLEINGGKDKAAQLEQEKQALAGQVAAQQAAAQQAAQQAAALQNQVNTLTAQQQAAQQAAQRTVTTRRATGGFAPQQLGFQINGLRQN